jgi:hypothetical protein
MNVFRSILGAAVLGASFLLPLSNAAAAPTETTYSGTTTVVLDKNFLAALTGLGIKPAALEPGRLVSSKGHGKGPSVRAVFPITTGAVDLGVPLKAEIDHAGGLSLTKDKTVVELTSFVIDLVNAAELTGLVIANNNLVGRIPLFDLDLSSASVGVKEGVVKVGNVAVKLSAEAAAALNGVFNTTAFTEGFLIGTAQVRAVVKIEDDDD